MFRLLPILYALVGYAPVSARAQFTETHLPILRIEVATPVPDEPKVTGTLRVIDNGPGALNRPDDPATGYEGFIGIERRGQSSLNWAKGSYGIETRKADGSNNNVELLGLPEENDWVLNGPFHDRSLLRNVFVYGLGRRLLAWSPRTRYVELFINDSYRGVYVLAEKIKRDRHRVDVAKLDGDDNSGPALTGGYVLKIDKGVDETEVNHFKSTYLPGGTHPEATIDVLYVDPKPDELTAAQRAYIQGYFNDFEDALAGPDFTDPQTGYAAYIDVGSFVDYLILSELTGNLDAYRVSTYFHKPRGGKLVMGPLWDYNFSLGSTYFCEADDVEQWHYEFNSRCTEDRWLVPFWWQRLLEDPAFFTRVRTRYTALRTGPLALDSLYARLDDQVMDLGEAAGRDYARWPGTRWLTPYETDTHAGEVAALYRWLDERIVFLDRQWLMPVLNQSTDWQVLSSAANTPLRIGYNLTAQTAVTLRLFNTTGKLIYQELQSLPAGRQVFRFSFPPPPGTYILQWQATGQAPEAQLVVRY